MFFGCFQFRSRDLHAYQRELQFADFFIRKRILNQKCQSSFMQRDFLEEKE